MSIFNVVTISYRQIVTLQGNLGLSLGFILHVLVKAAIIVHTCTANINRIYFAEISKYILNEVLDATLKWLLKLLLLDSFSM